MRKIKDIFRSIYNNKIKLSILVCIFALAIGYATTIVFLDINGTMSLGYDDMDDFNVYIDRLFVDDNNVSEYINSNGSKFTVELTSSDNTLKYHVNNMSSKYDAYINLICDNSSLEVEETYLVESLSSETKTIKVDVSNVQNTTCAINIERIEKTSKNHNLAPETISKKLQVGDVLIIYPTVSSYEITKEDTGCIENAINTSTGESACNGINGEPQIINPSEIIGWRVLNINEDGTVDAIAEYPSTTKVSLYGRTGYIKLVSTLNKIANQYQNPIIESAKIMGYNGQTGAIKDTQKVDSTTKPWESSTGDITTEDEYLGYGDS